MSKTAERESWGNRPDNLAVYHLVAAGLLYIESDGFGKKRNSRVGYFPQFLVSASSNSACRSATDNASLSFSASRMVS
jgi:hypothetical protein